MKEEIESEKKLKISVKNGYPEAQIKEETDRLNELVDWYKGKLKEITKAPIDSRTRKLEKLYQFSEANKDLGVTITRAGTLANNLSSKLSRLSS